MLPDGRVVTGGDDGRVLVWDPAVPGAGPAELGRHDGWVRAVAVLADGRVVTGGDDGRVLVWDPADPAPARPSWAATTARCGRWRCWPDGRVVTGGHDGRVLVWDPAAPGAGPAELGRHDGRVRRWRCWPDGRVVTGGNDGRVLVWDPAPRRRPGRAGPPRRPVRAVAVLAGRAGGHRRGRRAGAGVGPGRPGAARPSWAATTAGCARWRCCRTGGWSPAGRRAGAGVGPGPTRARPGRAGPPRRPRAVAVLPDGRVVTGGDDRRVLWDPDRSRAPGSFMLTCSVTALAAAPRGPASNSNLVIAHQESGFSLWSFTG